MPNKKITNKQERLVKKMYCQGKMGREISLKLKLSLKQIYSSLRRQKIMCKSLREQNRIIFERKPKSFHFKNKLSIKEHDLLVAAVMLYYGEGAKTGVTVDFANSDEKVIKLFLKFLRKICRIDEKRLKLYLYCFSDQNSNLLIRYWSSQLRVEKKQFTKPYVRSIFNRGKRSMPHGVIHLRYSDKKLLLKILSLCSEIITSL